LRLMSPKACMTGLHLGAAAIHLKGPSVTVGMPIRSEILADRTDAAAARVHFGLDPEFPTLLIFGGSQGAKALNQLMLQAIPFLSPQLQHGLQVIHLTGQEDCIESLSTVYSAHGIRNSVQAFEPRMGMAWSAATTALCRSGASTLAELRYFGVPAILVPYPFATDNHQDKNADVHVTCGCALKAQQQTLTPKIIATLLARLLNNHENCHNSMREALQKVKLDPPQKSLADVVLDTLNHAKL
jgi:UDP-N-acetylglucosamine--N-acetylmuramyl-(pentapeptide) pyrophosphoryl-undecaprenol N-acetylglucosamine transferase